MKLNRRGYVLVEIILASVIAFGIAYYMTNLTIKVKNKNNDLLAETLSMTDQAIIQNKLASYIQQDGYDFNCDNINIDNVNGIIEYTDKNGDNHTIDILNDYGKIDMNNYDYSCSDGSIYIYMPIKSDILEKSYVVELYSIPTVGTN